MHILGDIHIPFSSSFLVRNTLIRFLNYFTFGLLTALAYQNKQLWMLTSLPNNILKNMRKGAVFSKNKELSSRFPEGTSKNHEHLKWGKNRWRPRFELGISEMLWNDPKPTAVFEYVVFRFLHLILFPQSKSKSKSSYHVLQPFQKQVNICIDIYSSLSHNFTIKQNFRLAISRIDRGTLRHCCIWEIFFYQWSIRQHGHHIWLPAA